MRRKKLLAVSYIFYYAFLLISSIHSYMYNNMNAFFMSFVAIITPFLAPILLRLIKLHPTIEIRLANVLFAFIASILGSIWNGYSLPLFDKILHTSSGILITILAYMIYAYYKKETYTDNKNEQILALIFIFSFNMMIAVCWEFFEFFMLVFFNNDGINHYTTGVYDAMTDMLVAMIGSLIPMYYLRQYYKKQKKNYLIQLTDEFIQINH